MRANPIFVNKSPKFWAHVKFLSEQIGYSKRGAAQLRTHCMEDIEVVMNGCNFYLDKELLSEVLCYLCWRADILNNKIAPLLMNREEVSIEHKKIYDRVQPSKPLPMNKQKGEKRHPAYLSSIVGMIAEHVFGPTGFIDDARRLSIITSNNHLEEIFSRRFDGAIPNTINPIAVWEIKEYYGTTTFGSRVADGVYETLLDGYEIEGVRSRLNRDIQHFLFIDDRYTWWDCGKSYLCRMIDMLHTSHVDEIFFGKEVITDWEPRLRQLKETSLS